LALALAACGSGGRPSQPAAVEPASATAPPEPQQAAGPPAVPAIRQDLAATDPTQVALGSGRPTLVEFFAFW
jgi:hypothetical protein